MIFNGLGDSHCKREIAEVGFAQAREVGFVLEWVKSRFCAGVKPTSGLP